MSGVVPEEVARDRAVELVELLLEDHRPRALVVDPNSPGSAWGVRILRADHGNTNLDAYGGALVGVYDLFAEVADVVDDLLAVSEEDLAVVGP